MLAGSGGVILSHCKVFEGQAEGLVLDEASNAIVQEVAETPCATPCMGATPTWLHAHVLAS